MTLPKINDEYLSDGNNPEPVKGGKFPVLQLSDGSRYVGRAGQTFEELRAEAKERGVAK